MQEVAFLFFKAKSNTYTSNPLISVCIPVYNTEKYLEKCLYSVAEQDFKSFEIIIINDFSNDHSSKIIKSFIKNCNNFRKIKGLEPVKIIYYENNKNLGLVETRRIGFNLSRGIYITQLDSDDSLTQHALKDLYNSTCNNYYDIVQGTIICEKLLDNNVTILAEKKDCRNNAVFFNNLNGHEIFEGYYKKKYDCVLWGKLIKRELYEKAFSNIPFCFCTYGEDVFIFFFLSLFAKTYIGVNKVCYKYLINTGLSNFELISDIKKWEQICTRATAVNILQDFVNKNPVFFNSNEKNIIPHLAYTWLQSTLYIYKNYVSNSIKKDADEVFYSFWGESIKSFVNE